MPANAEVGMSAPGVVWQCAQIVRDDFKLYSRLIRNGAIRHSVAASPAICAGVGPCSTNDLWKM